MDNATPLDPSSRFSPFQGSGKNYWIVSEKTDFLRWYPTFPGGETKREFLDFLKFMLNVAEEEQIYRVTRAPLSESYYEKYPEKYREYSYQRDNIAYSEMMEQVFIETGNLIFEAQINGVLPNSPGQCRVYATTKLSCYDSQGFLVESDVDDIGALLRAVSPVESIMPFDTTFAESDRTYWENYHRKDRAYGPALYFTAFRASEKIWADYFEAMNSSRREIVDALEKPSSSFISIASNTDIWFPKVFGWLERERFDVEIGQTMPLFDNRELAERNAPRLNRFLKRVRQQIEAMGGSWKYDYSEAPKEYMAMCSEDGIIIHSDDAT